MFSSGFSFVSSSSDRSTPYAARVEMKSVESVNPIEEDREVELHFDRNVHLFVNDGLEVKAYVPGISNIAA